MILVYKIDRLIRSPTDFAKLVELFDANGVSFASVTQASTPPTALSAQPSTSFYGSYWTSLRSNLTLSRYLQGIGLPSLVQGIHL